MTRVDAWHRAVAASAAAAGEGWAAPVDLDAGGVWLCETGHLAAIALGGEDARDFLEAQLTCRVPPPDASLAQPGAWCNPKGRVISTLVVLPCAGEGYLLVLPATLAERVASGLSRYVLRARVTIDALPARQPRFGVWLAGGEAGAPLPGLTLDRQASPWAVLTDGDMLAVRVAGPADRWLLVAPAEAAAERWQALGAVGRPHDQRPWRLVDIRSGWPWLDDATSEQFVPQALGLDRSGAVSFDKGCYPGQEIVARIHYRGRASQRLAGVAGTLPAPAPGARLLAPGDSQASGRMLDAVPVSAERYEGLAVVASGCAPGTRLAVEGAGAGTAEVQPWPQLG